MPHEMDEENKEVATAADSAVDLGDDASESDDSGELGRSIEDAHEAARQAGFGIGSEADDTDHSGWAAAGEVPDLSLIHI